MIRRAGVIGDVHAEHERLDRALEFFAGQGVDVILCTGDLADGSGSVDVCCDLLRQSGAVTVAGNHDRWLLNDQVRHIDGAHQRSEISPESISYIESLSQTETLDTPDGELLLCHGVADNDLRKVWPGTERMPIERSHELDTLVDQGQLRYIVNGHLHYRVIIDFQELTLINAGTLVGRHRPGVSIIDFETHTVSAFEVDAANERVAERELEPQPERRIWRDTQEFDGDWVPVTLY
jgi:predicted phosphodiesterase